MVALLGSGQLRLRLAWGRPATTSSPCCRATCNVQSACAAAAGLARPASGIGERPDPGDGEEARQHGGGGVASGQRGGDGRSELAARVW
jgi:hypothetical protein